MDAGSKRPAEETEEPPNKKRTQPLPAQDGKCSDDEVDVEGLIDERMECSDQFSTAEHLIYEHATSDGARDIDGNLPEIEYEKILALLAECGLSDRFPVLSQCFSEGFRFSTKLLTSELDSDDMEKDEEIPVNPKSFAFAHKEAIFAAIQRIQSHLTEDGVCYLAQINIDKIYAILQPHPENTEMLSAKYIQKCYDDMYLDFEEAVPCEGLKALSNALQSIFRKKHNISSSMVCLMDRFLFIDSDPSRCKESMENFKSFCDSLNVPIALDSPVEPSHQAVFLGVYFDTQKLIAYLPKEEIDNIVESIGNRKSNKWSKKRSMSQILSLAAKLTFCSSLFRYQGRTLCLSLYELLGKRSKASVFLTHDVSMDLKAWQTVLRQSHSMSIRSDDSKAAHRVYIDSVTSGFGIVYGSSWWCSGLWPKPWMWRQIAYSMDFLNLYPVWIALVTSKEQWSNSNVIIHTKSTAVRKLLARFRTNDQVLRILLRNIWILCNLYNIKLRTKIVFENYVSPASLLAWRKIEKFKKTCPTLEYVAIPATCRPERFELPEHLRRGNKKNKRPEASTASVRPKTSNRQAHATALHASIAKKMILKKHQRKLKQKPKKR